MNARIHSRHPLTTVTTEGGILPSDLLDRLLKKDTTLPGQKPDDYHYPGQRLNDVISRAWSDAKEAWKSYRKATDGLQSGAPGTTETRERWLLPLFQILGYGRLQTSRIIEVGDQSYALSHLWQNTPIHLVGCGVDLDKRTKGVAGAAHSNPHGLVQDLLNRSETFLWGFLSNGKRLRIMRDNKALTRQAFLEFDLESIMDGEQFADFTLLWMLCHESRVEGEKPEQCWLEKWSREAQKLGARALDRLRDGVKEAIEAFGQGFLAYPTNQELRAKLQRSGATSALSKEDYYRQILRIVYRLLFLFVAEDRDLLFDRPEYPEQTPESVAFEMAKARYLDYYSTARLRRMARMPRGTNHPDLYRQFRLVCERLGSREGCPELALPALGSFLFSPKSTEDLSDCDISNHYLLLAISKLAWIRDGEMPRPVDYRNLQTEELGSVYESLLELHPELDVVAAKFVLREGIGSDRKKTGSYYTHPDLVQSLLDSALDPILEAATRKPDPVKAILALKVCDPACGSGHFLIAAAHRIARRLAQVRTGEEEPSPEATTTARRQVIGHCIYGVDMNPWAVELCKVALWMEALEPGKPLTFLERKILCGNSLIGVIPALLAKGIPDEAFDPIQGDDKVICVEFRNKNRTQHDQYSLFDSSLSPWEELGNLAASMTRLDEMSDRDFDAVTQQESAYEKHLRSQEYVNNTLFANAWCAAFVWKKQRSDTGSRYPFTQEYLYRLRRSPFSIDPWMRQEIDHLAQEYQFFHWHLAFPDVFRPERSVSVDTTSATGWKGGFDVLLGNPPWERIKLQEKEWFAAKNDEISNASNTAARRKMIQALVKDDPSLFQEFEAARRKSEGESHFIRHSGLYPLTGRGDVNTYAIFAETSRTVISPIGRLGIIVQSGIATDDTTKFFFQDLVEKSALASLYDFENRKKLFPTVDSRMKFCLLTIRGVRDPNTEGADFVFFALETDDLKDETKRFRLTPDEIRLLNPNTQTCSIFRSRRDAEITKAIYRHVPILWQEGLHEQNPWNLTFNRLFDMANDSHQFRTAQELLEVGYHREGNLFVSAYDRYLPLYEAKMVHQFDHRWATYTSDIDTSGVMTKDKADPYYVVQPRYWVREEIVESALPKFPAFLHRALLTEQENRIRFMLMLWVAGNYANRNEPAEMVHALERAMEYLPERASVNHSLPNRIEIFAAELEAKHPLSPAYIQDILERLDDDPIGVAETTIAQFSPRWLLGWRDIARANDVRTVISSFLPISAVGHKFLLMFPTGFAPQMAACLVANLNSLILDYAARQKYGSTSLNYFYMKQFPVLAPTFYREAEGACRIPLDRPLVEWISARVLELVYTALDMTPFARDYGYFGGPFLWDVERRFQIRCELDALYFHLYGINREDVGYILTTFPILMQHEPRTKEVVLNIYDMFARAVATGDSYVSPLNPLSGA